MRFGILTVSDGCFHGVREDESGVALVSWCGSRGDEVAAREVVPDETAHIVPVLLEWTDELDLDVVLTTGGTGLAPRDVTPEATRSVLEREVPGIAEELRRKGLESTVFSILSRGVAGVRGRTLIVNLPGSVGGVRDAMELLDPLVEHAVALLRGAKPAHTPPGGAS